MGFKLEFNTDNAAFTEDGVSEIQRILQSISKSIGFGHDSGKVHDINGNSVGAWAFDLSSDDAEDEDEELTTYRIVRFFKDPDRPKEAVLNLSGLTLEEAQEHCQREDTHGDDWFDGYEAE